MTQSEAVTKAIENLGGIATLQQIYAETFMIPDCEWGTNTPEASIRRIVRHTDGIFAVRKGLYALDSMKKSIESPFLYRKVVDKSVLYQGFTIPKSYHDLFHALAGGTLSYGDTRKVTFILGGEEYECEFKNQAFDKNKYAGHSEVIQFRYNTNSELAKRLRKIFHKTFDYVNNALQNKSVEDRSIIRIPKDNQEFIILSATNIPDVFLIDTVTTDESEQFENELAGVSEEEFELKTDEHAGIKEVTGIKKIRQLDRTIGDSLKKLYDYRCQMSGEKIGKEHGEESIVEAHHIVPFTKSFNNDTKNIIILSPNYHRIVHRYNAEFDKKELTYTFPNGLVEKVKLNKHL